MATITLDYTNAYPKSADRTPFANMAEGLAHRLKSEVDDGQLPFLTMPYMGELLGDLDVLMPELERFEHMLVLGIGGSALGARALQKAFAPGQDQPGHKGPWLWIADNVDAYALAAWFAKLPADKTLVVTISKSGGTIETISQYFLAKQWLMKELPATWNEHLFFITDKDKGFLRDQVCEMGARSLPVPDNLGGRYSALSAVGLLPAAFMGMDYKSLAHGAQDMAGELGKANITTETLTAHPAFELACWNTALMQAGYSELLFFSYIPQWATYGDWFAQLWAESLGKEGKGSQPIPAVGVTDQHSVNQMFLDGPRNKACLFLTCSGLPDGQPFPDGLPDKFDYLNGKRFGELIHAEALGTHMALVQTNVPLVNMHFQSDGIYSAGRMMLLLELTTILTGWMLGINPVDQPAVELGKRLAKARLGATGLDKEKAELADFLEGERCTTSF